MIMLFAANNLRQYTMTLLLWNIRYITWLQWQPKIKCKMLSKERSKLIRRIANMENNTQIAKQCTAIFKNSSMAHITLPNSSNLLGNLNKSHWLNGLNFMVHSTWALHVGHVLSPVAESHSRIQPWWTYLIEPSHGQTLIRGPWAMASSSNSSPRHIRHTFMVGSSWSLFSSWLGLFSISPSCWEMEFWGSGCVSDAIFLLSEIQINSYWMFVCYGWLPTEEGLSSTSSISALHCFCLIISFYNICYWPELQFVSDNDCDEMAPLSNMILDEIISFINNSRYQYSSKWSRSHGSSP